MARQVKINFRLASDKVHALDSLAKTTNRDRSCLLNEAVEAYLDVTAVANRANQSLHSSGRWGS